MDGCNVESGARVLQSQPRLCSFAMPKPLQERFRGVPGHPFAFGFDLRVVPEKLGDPIRWSKPKKIFVNSMSDLFHEGVPDEYIEKVCRVMLAANWHTYQILTKRADRMAALLQGKLRKAAKVAHIWWGVSVENRKHGLPRITKLRSANPTVSFLSIEPLLEDLGKFDLRGIQWVIVGGGRAARAHARWKLSGCGTFATSAARRTWHFSLSNGAVFVKNKLAAGSTAKLMTSFRSAV